MAEVISVVVPTPSLTSVVLAAQGPAGPPGPPGPPGVGGVDTLALNSSISVLRTEVVGALATKADKADTYTISQTQLAIAGAAPSLTDGGNF